MRASPACVGLAANQIGSTLRAFCVDVTGHKKAVSCHGAFVLFDPQLLVARAPDRRSRGLHERPRPHRQRRARDRHRRAGRTPEGTERVIEADAFEARAILHELDHLDGLVFLDRVDVGRRRLRTGAYR